MGLGNVIEGEVVRMNDEGGRMKIKSPFGLYAIQCSHKHSKGDKVHLLARPLAAKEEANVIHGIVSDVIFQQDRFKVTLEKGVYIYLGEAPRIGQKISARVKVECLA